MTMLLVLLLQSTALLSLGLLALRLTRRFGPSVQSLVGRASLAGVTLLLLLTPLTGHVRPVVRVRLPQRVEPILSQEPTPLRSSATLPQREGEETPPPPILGEQYRSEAVIGQKNAARQEDTASSAPTMPTASPALPAPRLPVYALRHYSVSGERALALRVASAAPGGFLTISFVLLLWLGICQIYLMRLRRAAALITSGPAAALLAELTPHPPALLTHSSVHSPFLAGIRRPAIFLPPAFAADFAPDALRTVFLHELAHRDRRDNLWTLATRLLTAILWFQPLLWLLGRTLEQISEDACDAAVLVQCLPRAYAACLLSLAERPPLAHSQRTLTAGVAPFRSSLGRRIRHILTTQGVRPMPPLTLRLRLTAAALTLAGALGGAFLISSAPAQTTAPPATTAPASVAEAASTMVGYGLKIQIRSQKRYCQAIAGSVAARSGVPVDKYCEVTAVNRQPLPVSDRQFLTLMRSSPPLQVTLRTPDKQTHQFAFLEKRPFSVMTAAKAANEEQVRSLDEKLANQQANVAATQARLNYMSTFLKQGSSSVTAAAKAAKKEQVRSLFVKLADQQASVDLTKAQLYYTLRSEAPNKMPTTASAAERTAQLQHLTQELSRYRGNETPAAASNEPLNQAEFLAGLTPVQGPGVVVTLTDSKRVLPKGLPAGIAPPNIIHDSDINQVVNELRAAGAEAIAVNNQRLVATSAVRSAGPTVYVNNTPQAPPYVIKAIGDPKALAGALNMPGGEADQLKQYDKAMSSVRQAATLTLPAYSGGSEPRYAKPVGETAEDVAGPIRQKLQFLQAVDTMVKQRVHNLARLPKRTFQVDFQTPANGTHAIQVFVHDATGKRLVLSKVYQQRTSVNLPVAAVGEYFSFQIFDNGKRMKTQQMTSGSAPAASTAQSQAVAGTHTVVGYGLISFMQGKLLYCRAVKGSTASRLGLLTNQNYQVFGVNEKPVPQSIAQFAEVCHAAPPLRLLLRPVLLKNFHGWKSHLVVFPEKAAYTPPLNLITEESSAKYVQTAQGEAAKSKAMRGQTIQQLTNLIAVALPQSNAQTRAKAFNLEKRIGWSLDGLEYEKEYLAWRRKKRKIKIAAMTSALEANAQSYLAPSLAEEARIFPKTANTSQNLRQMHKLARQIGNMNTTVMEKQIQAQVITSLTRERSPDMSL